jgi:hypothetical protein
MDPLYSAEPDGPPLLCRGLIPLIVSARGQERARAAHTNARHARHSTHGTHPRDQRRAQNMSTHTRTPPWSKAGKGSQRPPLCGCRRPGTAAPSTGQRTRRQLLRARRWQSGRLIRTHARTHAAAATCAPMAGCADGRVRRWQGADGRVPMAGCADGRVRRVVNGIHRLCLPVATISSV